MPTGIRLTIIRILNECKLVSQRDMLCFCLRESLLRSERGVGVGGSYGGGGVGSSREGALLLQQDKGPGGGGRGGRGGRGGPREVSGDRLGGTGDPVHGLEEGHALVPLGGKCSRGGGRAVGWGRGVGLG